MKKIAALLFLFSCSFTSLSQQIQQSVSGLVLSKDNSPIPDVIVTVADADSTIVSYLITDDNGRFHFDDVIPYVLSFNIVGYKSVTVAGDESFLTITLDKDIDTLDEAVVVAERQNVTVTDQGALRFIPSKSSSVLPNALDVLKDNPMINQNGDSFEILGSGTASILIDGRKTKMSQEQVRLLLNSLPSKRISSIEIFHSAPAKFRTKEAVINVNLSHDKSDSLSATGIAQLGVEQKYYNSQDASVNLTISKGKNSFDLGYSFNHDKTMYDNNLKSNHYLISEGRRTAIVQSSQQRMGEFSHYYFADYNRTFRKDNSSFDIIYSGNFSQSDNSSDSQIYGFPGISSATNSYDNKTQIHSVSSAVLLGQWEINMNSVFYNKRKNQLLSEDNFNYLSSLSSQNDIDLSLSVDRSFNIKRNQISIGAEATFANSANKYDELEGNNNSAQFDLTQKERNISAYMDWSAPLGNKVRMNASLQVSYEYALLCNHLSGTSNELWNHLQLYPSINLVCPFAPKHMLRVAFSSERNVPSYWAMTSGYSYLSPYSAIVGNPLLQPKVTYKLNIPYVYNKKYIFGLSAEYSSKNFTQLAYQDSESLLLKYKYYNLKSSSNVGIFSAFPISWTSFFETQFNASIFWMCQKGNAEDIEFDRSRVSGRVTMRNNFTFDASKTLFAQLAGWYQLPSIQGYYNVQSIASVSAELRWHPRDANWTLSLIADDIFKTHRSSVKVNYRNQNFSWDNYMDYQSVKLSVSYSFNGHKNLENKHINTTRYGM